MLNQVNYVNDIALKMDPIETWKLMGYWPKIMEHYWQNITKSLGLLIHHFWNIDRDIVMLNMANIKSINSLNDLLINSQGCGEKYLENVYNESYGDIKKFPNHVSVSQNSIVSLFLIANYPEIFTNEILKLLGYAWPERITQFQKNNPIYDNL